MINKGGDTTLQWEHLSTTAFVEACKEVEGVCILPFGVLESHGPHLPLGTDIIEAKTIAVEAANIEPAVVFPSYYFGQLAGAQHIPGNICVRHDLLMQMLEEICEEISRNGLHKIVIFNAHGGNAAFLQYFLQSTLQKKKDYMVYSMNILSMIGESVRELYKNPEAASAALSQEDREILANVAASRGYSGHGGFSETAFVMGVDQKLVHLGRKDEVDYSDRGRLDHLEQAGLSTWMNWYAKYPNNYAGDPAGATETIGKAMIQYIARKAAHAIKVVKEDKVALDLQNEFFSSW